MTAPAAAMTALARASRVLAPVLLGAVAFVAADGTGAPPPSFRVFQTLPAEPAAMTPAERAQTAREIRATRAMVFAPPRAADDSGAAVPGMALDVYTPAERREYLVRRGSRCHPRAAPRLGELGELGEEGGDAALPWYDVLSRYDALTAGSEGSVASGDEDAVPRPELGRLAIELFKLCVLHNGDGHAFLGWGERLLRPLRDVVSLDGNYAVAAADAADDAAGDGGGHVHEAFLFVSPYARGPPPALASALRRLLETSNDALAARPRLPARELHRAIAAGREGGRGDDDPDPRGDDSDSSNSERGHGAAWTLLRTRCTPLADASARCPLSAGGYCCFAFHPSADATDDAGGGVLALRHPATAQWRAAGGRDAAAPGPPPYKFSGAAEDGAPTPLYAGAAEDGPLPPGGVGRADLPYVATVRLRRDHAPDPPVVPSPAARFPTHPADSPNFFDILFENDCLPYRKECHRCLKDVANEAFLVAPQAADAEGAGDAGDDTAAHAAPSPANACASCRDECPCYCDVLCVVRPPPKPLARTYAVRPPARSKEPARLVPKIVHQTWFEPVTQEKYPNMSRLIESWKKSGWEYYFYDDEAAGEFLGTHFPPEVREAYESVVPGAFKADLFRYCVLLIRGGVYADMDVLLQTNLDNAVADDIGFMTPIDNPGIDVGHRSCLWNGLIASAPAHPFLARTIEIVVNNIRNRFTAVDYDDMLCPDPVLSVSHTVDTLFTCGPCILGASINNLLGRHMQAQFEVGDVGLWQGAQEGAGGSNGTAVHPDDQRLLIPGRTVMLEQNKNDMGAHRFTWADEHLIIATTDMPDYDDRPPTKEHYSKTHEKAGVYGVRKLYTDTRRANEEIRFVVEHF